MGVPYMIQLKYIC